MVLGDYGYIVKRSLVHLLTLLTGKQVQIRAEYANNYPLIRKSKSCARHNLITWHTSSRFKMEWDLGMGFSYSRTPVTPKRGGRGGTLNFKWRGWSKDFLGLKFSIRGFFWVGEIGKYFFCVWLDLRTFALIVSAHPYCARNSLQRHALSARAVREMWRYVALVAPLVSMHGFNSLKCSVTPYFLLINHFLCQLSTFWEKLKKICIVEVWFFSTFLPSHHRIMLLL